MYYIISLLFCVLSCDFGGLSVINSTLNIIPRSEWGARKPVDLPEETPISEYVIIYHCATKSCLDEASCKELVNSIQNYHMDNNFWYDIAYNFIVGEDGKVYEGRGWKKSGAPSPGYNSKSIDHLPSDVALNAVRNLITYGVNTQNISPSYKLMGHNQASSTLWKKTIQS